MYLGKTLNYQNRKYHISVIMKKKKKKFWPEKSKVY